MIRVRTTTSASPKNPSSVGAGAGGGRRLTHDVGAEPVEQHRGIARRGLHGIGDGIERLDLDDDQLGRVGRRLGAPRAHDGDRLAHEPHAVAGEQRSAERLLARERTLVRERQVGRGPHRVTPGTSRAADTSTERRIPWATWERTNTACSPSATAQVGHEAGRAR